MKFLTNRALFSFLLLINSLALAEVKDINRIYRATPSLNQFEICQGGGCAKISTAQLSLEEWQQVTAIFNPAQQGGKLDPAEQERARIAQAIGLLEKVVGKKVGTDTDLAGTFDNSDIAGQMDCNDEAINSTTYMRLLQQAGYIKLHEIEDMRTRNFFFTGWPHTTAVIRESKNGARFAVDSWFYDNGHAATIVPFAQWKANYQPADSPVGKARKQAERSN